MYIEELEMWIPEDVDPRLEAMQEEWDAREAMEMEARREARAFNEIEAAMDDWAADEAAAEMEDIPF